MNKSIIESPHGGGSQAPDTIVVHAMGEFIADGKGGFDHAVPFLNSYKLSAHSLIGPDGHNYRLRNDEETAWHARGSNRNSLGLEFLVQGDHDYGTFIEALKTPYLTKLQYSAGVEQAREWIDLFNIARVVRHSDLSPGRKVDPGVGFPWSKFLHDIGMT